MLLHIKFEISWFDINNYKIIFKFVNIILNHIFWLFDWINFIVPHCGVNFWTSSKIYYWLPPKLTLLLPERPKGLLRRLKGRLLQTMLENKIFISKCKIMWVNARNKHNFSIVVFSLSMRLLEASRSLDIHLFISELFGNWRH